MKYKLTFALVASLTSTAFAAFQAPLPEFKNERQLAEWRAEKASETTSQSYAAEETGFYTGKPYLPSSGDYAFKYRSYNPEMARWTSEDPSGYPDGANNQIYVNNSATGCFDSQGLWTISVLDWNQHKFAVPTEHLAYGSLGLATATGAGASGAVGAAIGTTFAFVGAIPGAIIGAVGGGAASFAAAINIKYTAFIDSTESYYKRDHADQVFGPVYASFNKTMEYETGLHPTVTGSTKSVYSTISYSYSYDDLGVAFKATVWSSEVFRYE